MLLQPDDFSLQLEIFGSVVREYDDEGAIGGGLNGAEQALHQALLRVAAAVVGLESDANDLLLELEDVGGLEANVHVPPEVGTEIVEGDQQVTGNVGLCLLDSGHDLLGQVEDGIFVRLDGLGGIHYECERGVDDGVTDRR